MRVSLIVAFVLALLMAFFALQNAQHTQVSFMGWYFDGPLVIVLLLSFAAGAIVTFLTMLPGTVRKSIEISKQRTRLLACEQQLAALEKRPSEIQHQCQAPVPLTGATTL